MGTFFIFVPLFKRMRIFSKGTLRDFWEKQPETEQYLKTWYDTVSKSDWSNPNEVKSTYANASILKESRVVFNIMGNSYRLIAKINFEKKWLFVRFIGSHKEYDQIDANLI